MKKIIITLVSIALFASTASALTKYFAASEPIIIHVEKVSLDLLPDDEPINHNLRNSDENSLM